eukprot:15340700-Alexandrium_andersonii.AAC.1
MPARIGEVREYIGGLKRNRAYSVWIEQRRQEALREEHAAARASAGGVDVRAFADAGDWSESGDEAAESLFDVEA